KQHREGEEQQRRRRGERDERREGAAPPGAQQSEAEPRLAAGRAREKLGEPEQLGELRFGHPAPALDDLAAEVSDVRDRAAEGREPQAQERREDLGGRAARRALHSWTRERALWYPVRRLGRLQRAARIAELAAALEERGQPREIEAMAPAHGMRLGLDPAPARLER